MAIVKELEAKMEDLRNKRDAIVAELKQTTRERDELVLQEEVAEYSEDRKAALLRALSVESTASVGKAGSR